MVSSTDDTRDLPDHAKFVGALSVVLGGLAALLSGMFTVSLVREQLHLLCSTGPPGTEGAGSWVCVDGIGYLHWAVLLGGMTVALVIAGALVAGLVRNDLAARVALVLLSATPVCWAVVWTWIGSNHQVQAVPPGVQSVDYWFSAVAPAAIVAALALGVALVGLRFRGAIGRVLTWVAAVGLAAATIVQPGLGIATLLAVGHLVGSIARIPSSRPTTRPGTERPPRGLRQGRF